METIIVKSKNILVLPPQLAKKYSIRPGVKIFFEEADDYIKIFPLSKEIIDINKGFLGKSGNFLNALMKEKKL